MAIALRAVVGAMVLQYYLCVFTLTRVCLYASVSEGGRKGGRGIVKTACSRIKDADIMHAKVARN